MSAVRAAKYLITNADDFGFTPGVNAGIVEAHEKGILTAATLMANIAIIFLTLKFSSFCFCSLRQRGVRSAGLAKSPLYDIKR